MSAGPQESAHGPVLWMRRQVLGVWVLVPGCPAGPGQSRECLRLEGCTTASCPLLSADELETGWSCLDRNSVSWQVGTVVVVVVR